MNHFELFELSCQFELDDSFLSSQFRELQRRYHPDKFAMHSDKEKLAAVQQAALVNEAYQTLRDPIKRAEYLISLHQELAPQEYQRVQDTDFLMTQLMLREELEAISVSTSPEADLMQFESQVTDLYQDLMRDLKERLQQAQWIESEAMVNKLKFVVKLQHEIERVEEQLFD